MSISSELYCTNTRKCAKLYTMLYEDKFTIMYRYSACQHCTRTILYAGTGFENLVKCSTHSRLDYLAELEK